MALNKVNIPVAAGGKNEFDLSCDHQTSMNFLLAQPIYYRHVPRGEHFTDDTIGVIRPVSIAQPTFGRIRNNLRAFWVPYRLVHPQYDAARADVLGYSYSDADIPALNPRVSHNTIIDYFLHTVISGVGALVSDLGTTSPVDSDNNPLPYDFYFGGHYYNYTAAGRRRLKLLRSLGYEPLWIDDKTPFFYDILGLLCYARVYLDWYSNAQYLDSSSIIDLRKILAYNNPTVPLNLTTSQFGSLLSLVFNVVYDSDEYFNAAWDTPIAPTLSQSSAPVVVDYPDSSPNVTKVDYDSNGTPLISQSSASTTSTGSQYIHDMLQALSNFQRRHALSGAREIDRALSDYGFASDYSSLNRAVYIGNRSFDIQIGDVYSTADTSTDGVSNLGSYAGRGFGNGRGSFDFTASEDGMIIIVSTIIPSCGIVQGYDRNNRHLNKYDMYDPNFEIGVQILEAGEVYVSSTDAFYQGDSELLSNKFGYTGRFGEYKRPRSWWTSENRLPSVNAGGDAWNLFRLFSDDSFDNDPANVVHSLNFTRAIDWETFNRIFTYMNSDRDKFECFYHHEVHCQSPMKPLFETYDFKETHKQIKMDINGSKLN